MISSAHRTRISRCNPLPTRVSSICDVTSRHWSRCADRRAAQPARWSRLCAFARFSLDPPDQEWINIATPNHSTARTLRQQTLGLFSGRPLRTRSHCKYRGSGRLGRRRQDQRRRSRGPIPPDAEAGLHCGRGRRRHTRPHSNAAIIHSELPVQIRCGCHRQGVGRRLRFGEPAGVVMDRCSDARPARVPDRGRSGGYRPNLTTDALRWLPDVYRPARTVVFHHGPGR